MARSPSTKLASAHSFISAPPSGGLSTVSLHNGVAVGFSEPITETEEGIGKTTGKKKIAIVALVGFVAVAAIVAWVGVEVTSTDSGEITEIEGQAALFAGNYDAADGNAAESDDLSINSNSRNEAGYLERCNPGYGYGALDAPKCKTGLECVTNNKFSSWCMSCDTEREKKFSMQCSLANPSALANLEIVCGAANPKGCKARKHAGRGKQCNPGGKKNKFSIFRPCRPGLECVKSNDNEYTQCVKCAEPFWSEDCVFWKKDFRAAAKAVCGKKKCNKKAGRDERCSPTPEHHKFGKHPVCASGLRCATTKFHSQCVTCKKKKYLNDCKNWSPVFKKAAAKSCPKAPACGEDPTTPARSGHRCSRSAHDMQFIKYPQCIDKNDAKDLVKCAATGHYSQCVRCKRWNKDCLAWTPTFLKAAETACGLEGKGCAPANACAGGIPGDADGSCVADPQRNGETCDSDLDSATKAELAGPAPANPPKWCHKGLKCLAGGAVKQCVDCGAKFLDDCPYWKGSFLEAAEAQCERKCVLMTSEPGACTTDAQCGTAAKGWACVATSGYSQCVQCKSKKFSWDCGFWEGSFLEAAELRCGRNCEPEVYPGARPAAPALPTKNN